MELLAALTDPRPQADETASAERVDIQINTPLWEAAPRSRLHQIDEGLNSVVTVGTAPIDLNLTDEYHK